MATGNAKNFELKIGKAGLFIVLGGMTALLCVAFIFGVSVGKNIDTYPGEIASLPQKALAMVWRPAKIKMAQQQAAQAGESSSAPKEENLDFTYHSTLTGKKELFQNEAIPDKQAANVTTIAENDLQKGKFHIETNSPAVVTAKESIELQEKKQQVITKANNDKEDPARERTGSSENTVGKQKFIVQVASLKDKSKAYEMNRKVAALGFQSKIIKAELKGKGVVYRLIVTGLNNQDQARKVAGKISAKTGSNCIIKKIDIKTN